MPEIGKQVEYNKISPKTTERNCRGVMKRFFPLNLIGFLVSTNSVCMVDDVYSSAFRVSVLSSDFLSFSLDRSRYIIVLKTA